MKWAAHALLSAVLYLAACDPEQQLWEPIPGWSNSTTYCDVLTTDLCVDPVLTGRGLQAFTELYINTFNIDPTNSLQDIHIEWGADFSPNPNYSIVNGETVNIHKIIVRPADHYSTGTGSIDGTGFVHELEHLVLWNNNNNPDWNHEVSPGPWTQLHTDVESTNFDF